MLQTIGITLAILAIVTNGGVLIFNYIYKNDRLLAWNVLGLLGGVLALYLALL